MIQRPSNLRKFSFALAVALLLFPAAPAGADQYQDFIIGKLKEAYDAFVLQARGDSGKKAKLTNIYKTAVKVVQSKPGLGGRPDAEKARSDMAAVVK
jgi:hypothetical protein